MFQKKGWYYDVWTFFHICAFFFFLEFWSTWLTFLIKGMLHIFHVDMLWDRGIPTSNLESGSQLIGLMESLAETRIFQMVGFSQVRFVGNPHFFAA